MRDSMKYWKKPKMKCDIFQGYYFGKPVANNTFIITPYNVGFVGEDLVGELENNGVFI